MAGTLALVIQLT